MSLRRYVLRGVATAALFVAAAGTLAYLLEQPPSDGKASAMLSIILYFTGWPSTMLFSLLDASVIVSVPVSWVLYSLPTLLNGGLVGAAFYCWLER